MNVEETWQLGFTASSDGRTIADYNPIIWTGSRVCGHGEGTTTMLIGSLVVSDPVTGIIEEWLYAY